MWDVMEKEIQQYQRQISRQNHLVAQVAYTITFYSTDCQVSAER